jgi:hypothetical protein
VAGCIDPATPVSEIVLARGGVIVHNPAFATIAIVSPDKVCFAHTLTLSLFFA